MAVPSAGSPPAGGMLRDCWGTDRRLLGDYWGTAGGLLGFIPKVVVRVSEIIPKLVGGGLLVPSPFL